jgi:hypothetical protein
METYSTFSTQVELLPRITIVYGFNKPTRVHIEEDRERGSDYEMVRNGIAFEWLWFGVFIEFGNAKKSTGKWISVTDLHSKKDKE